MPDFLFCNAELFKKRKKKKKRKEEHKTLPGCLKYAKIAKLGKQREREREKKKKKKKVAPTGSPSDAVVSLTMQQMRS